MKPGAILKKKMNTRKLWTSPVGYGPLAFCALLMSGCEMTISYAPPAGVDFVLKPLPETLVIPHAPPTTQKGTP